MNNLKLYRIIVFTGLFLLRKADTVKMKTIGIATTAFCMWMTYAGGLLNMFMTSVFYLAGIGFYIKGRNSHKTLFTRKERYLLALLILSSVITLIILPLKT